MVEDIIISAQEKVDPSGGWGSFLFAGEAMYLCMGVSFWLFVSLT